jgi:hypothetical protein
MTPCTTHQQLRVVLRLPARTGRQVLVVALVHIEVRLQDVHSLLVDVLAQVLL